MRDSFSPPERLFRFRPAALALALTFPCVGGAQTLSRVSVDTARTPSAFLDVASDAEGNSIAVGRFRGSFRMGGLSLESGAARSLFVASISRDGKVRWLREIRPGPAARDWTAHAAVDPGGNAILALHVDDDFDPIRIADSLAPNPKGPFLVKLDGEGRIAWILKDNPSGGSPNIWYTTWFDVGTDALGNIYAAGSILKYASDIPYKSAFLFKFSPEGVPLWNWWPGGYRAVEGSAGHCLAVPPRGGAYLSTSYYSGSHLLMKINEEGNRVWETTIKPASWIRSASRVAVDPEGGVFLADTAAISSLFEDSSERSAPERPFVMARYSAEGEVLWARRYPVAAPPEGLAPAPWGGFILAAARSGAPGLGLADPDSADPAGGLLVAGFSPDGTPQWMKGVRGTGPGSGGIDGCCLATDADGLFLAGNFRSGLRADAIALETPPNAPDAGGETLTSFFRLRWEMPWSGIAPPSGRSARHGLRPRPQGMRGTVSFTSGARIFDARGRFLSGGP